MRRARLRLVMVALALLLLAGGTVSAWAWWTDQGTVRSGAVATAVLPAPTARCGAVGVASVRFDWTSVTGATRYVVHYGANGARTQVTTGTSFLALDLIGQGTFWVTAQRQFTGTTWTSVPSNRLTYTVAAVSLCG